MNTTHAFLMLYLAYKFELCAIANRPPDEFDLYLKDVDFLAHSQTVTTFLTTANDGTIVGFIIYEDRADSTYVHEIYIVPDYRRRGFGSRLMEGVKAIGKPIRLEVINNNHVGLSFWKSLLGEPSETTPHRDTTIYEWRNI